MRHSLVTENPPFPVSPYGGKPGRAGSPHAATRYAPAQTAGTHRAAAPPTRGAAAPLVHPPAGFQHGSTLYGTKRTCHLLIKPDNLTCHQHTEKRAANCRLWGQKLGGEAGCIFDAEARRRGDKREKEELPSPPVSRRPPRLRVGFLVGT